MLNADRKHRAHWYSIPGLLIHLGHVPRTAARMEVNLDRKYENNMKTELEYIHPAIPWQG